MRHLFHRLRHEDRGVLAYEWILLISLLAIGLVGGLGGLRDAVITELGDIAGAAVHVDQSYTVEVTPCGGGFGYENFGFQDELPDCTGTGERADPPSVTQGIVTSPCP